jgi:hypothetical protein
MLCHESCEHRCKARRQQAAAAWQMLDKASLSLSPCHAHQALFRTPGEDLGPLRASTGHGLAGMVSQGVDGMRKANLSNRRVPLQRYPSARNAKTAKALFSRLESIWHELCFASFQATPAALAAA